MGPGHLTGPVIPAAEPPSSLVVGDGDVDGVQLAVGLQLPFLLAREVLLLLLEPALEEVSVESLELRLVVTELLHV